VTKSPDAIRKTSREILWKMERVPEEPRGAGNDDEGEECGKSRGAKRRMEYSGEGSSTDVTALVYLDHTVAEPRSIRSTRIESNRTNKGRGLPCNIYKTVNTLATSLTLCIC